MFWRINSNTFSLYAGKDVHWILGLDGAISWDPYIEDDGIESLIN